MANTLLLPDTRETNAIIRPELEQPSGIDFPLAVHFDAASGQLSAAGEQVYPTMDFLASVVTPIYCFIEEEVSTKREN